MRIFIILFCALSLAGCGGNCFSPQGYCSSPYARRFSPLDLRQVRAVYSNLRPIYEQFKVADRSNNSQGLASAFAREQRLCVRVDTIDRRDTIDPNTNLFQASTGLDTLCNTIESIYAGWREQRHLPFDKSISAAPATDPTVFEGADKTIAHMAKWLEHPSTLS